MLLEPGEAVGTRKDGNCPGAKVSAEPRRLSAEDPGPNPGLERELEQQSWGFN